MFKIVVQAIPCWLGLTVSFLEYGEKFQFDLIGGWIIGVINVVILRSGDPKIE